MIITRKLATPVRLLIALLLIALPAPLLCKERFEAELEDSLLVLTNAERIKHELRPLKMYSPVTEVARHHSLDMFKRGFFAHVNPDGMDVWDRLNIAGIWFASCAENVGKTLNVTNAHNGFMKSELHRKNILTEEYTHVGMGILAAPDGYIYVTQNFIETIDTVDVDSTASLIEATLNRKRINRKYTYLRRNSSIDSLAIAHSHRMLSSEKPNMPQSFGGIKTRACAFHYVTPSLDKVYSDRDLLYCSGTKIGIGVAQGNSRKYGNGLLWITIIVVQ